MVYCGVVSKGCERCRQRKIKGYQCDQTKPACVKCQKSKTQCPGYRNLHEVVFRDESERIVRKARQIKQSKPTLAPSLPSSSIPHPLSQPIKELGANFFFKKYTLNEPPFTNDYNDWILRSYLEDDSNHVLRAVINAVGMSGMSNVFHAPHVAVQSKKQYCEALAALKVTLNDPVQAIADTTLLAVILFGLYEAVNFDDWDRYCNWEAHVKGATALLALRGQAQFTKDRGGLLYILTRSQILLACMQRHMAVPPALVQTSCDFYASTIRDRWRDRKVASPASICEISFRVVNLSAAFENGEITDPQAIRERAMEIDADLETWSAILPQSWSPTIIDAPESHPGIYFDGKRHIYHRRWTAEIWNSWRTLRIVLNQIILRNELISEEPDRKQKFISRSIILQCSTDICLSASSFAGTPCVASLMRPMYVVALERLNSYRVRSFAIDQLRSIAAEMGIRKASLMAETISPSLSEAPQGEYVYVPSRVMIPMIPCG